MTFPFPTGVEPKPSNSVLKKDNLRQFEVLNPEGKTEIVTSETVLFTPTHVVFVTDNNGSNFINLAVHQSVVISVSEITKENL